MQTFTSKAIKLMVVAMTFMSFGAFAQSSDPSLLMHFSFDGNTVSETSGNSTVNVTDNNTSSIADMAGVNGNARAFQSGAYLSLEDVDGKVDQLSEFTLSAWVFSPNAGSRNTIVSKVNPNRDFVLSIFDGKPAFHFNVNFDEYYFCFSPDPLPLNQWVHIVATFDNGTMSIYVDGELKNTRVVTEATIGWTGTDLEIGSFHDGSEPFEGFIDEVKIYNRALSAEEVATDGGFCTKTVEVAVYDTTNVMVYDTTNVTVYDTMACNGNPPSADDLIFHFNFNNESLNEVSGNSSIHVKADQNTYSTDDRNGDALGARAFGSGYLVLEDSLDEAKNLSEFTMSAWVYTGDKSRETMMVLTQVNPNRDFTLSIFKGKPTFHIYNNGGYDFLSSPDSLPLNEWVHIAGTWNNGEMAIYMNGELKNSRTATRDIAWTGTDLRIGTMMDGTQTFYGNIDDVKFYGKALSAQEIAAESNGKTVEVVTVYDTVQVVQVIYDTVEVVERTTVTDTLVLDKITGLANGASNQMIAYPNPARDIVFVNTGDYSLMTGYSISVTNLQGQEVFVDAIDEQLIEIDVDALGAAGLYFLNVVNGSGEIVDSKKLLVK